FDVSVVVRSRYESLGRIVAPRDPRAIGGNVCRHPEAIDVARHGKEDVAVRPGYRSRRGLLGRHIAIPDGVCVGAGNGLPIELEVVVRAACSVQTGWRLVGANIVDGGRKTAVLSNTIEGAGAWIPVVGKRTPGGGPDVHAVAEDGRGARDRACPVQGNRMGA